MSLNGKNILVTGGAGFIGSHVCEKLLDLGCHVICVDNLDDYYSPSQKLRNIEGALKDPRFFFYKIDVADYEKIAPLFELYKIDAIIHLAGRGGVVPSSERPLFYVRTNVHGTLCMLEAARHYEVPKFVFASSSSVYGPESKIPFNEGDKCDFQVSPYGATKRSAELLIKNYHYLYGIDCAVLRFFTVFGPRARPDMALNKFTEKIINGEEIGINKGMRRDFTYIDDIVSGIIAATEKKVGFQIINLGNSNPISVRKYVKSIENAFKVRAKIKETKAGPGELLETMANISKAKKMLNYKPKTKVEDGVVRFAKWYKENNSGYKKQGGEEGHVKIAVFDFDGTIVNVEKKKGKIFGELIEKKWGGDKNDAAKFYFEVTGPSRRNKFDFYYKKIFKKQLSNEDYKVIEKEFDRQLKKELYAKAKPMPGALSLLRFARSHFEFVYVCSGVPNREINYVTEKMGLKKYFDRVIGTDEHYTSKLVMFSEIMRTKRPTLMISVSDSEIDVRNAKEFGLISIGIPSNKPAAKLKAAGADIVCEIPELSKKIEEIFKKKFK